MKTVMMNRKRMVSIFLMFMMAMGLFIATPATAFAADHQVSDATEFAAALNASSAGDMITLTANIDYDNNIDWANGPGHTITINLNTFTLNMIGLGYNLAQMQVIQGPGTINFDTGLAIQWVDLSITNGAVINTYGCALMSSKATITNSTANVSVTGDSPNPSFQTGELTVVGDVYNNADTYFEKSGVYAGRNGMVTIGGNVNVTGTDGIGVNILFDPQNMGGLNFFSGGEVTVDGTITAPNYIMFQTSGMPGEVNDSSYYRTPGEFVDPSDPRNKPGYLMYMSDDELSFVWVGDSPQFPITQPLSNFTGSGNLVAIIDAKFDNFVGLLLDGDRVDPANYSVTEGSTILTLYESYLKTLPKGTHTFRVLFTDGFVELPLTVIAPTTSAAGSPTTDVPQTSDINGSLGWTVVLAFVILGIFGLLARRRKQSV